MIQIIRILYILVPLLAFLQRGPAAHAQSRTEGGTFDSAEKLVRDMYASVSFEADGPRPDWERVKSMFLDDAIIVLRVTRDSSALFSVADFIDDFKRFIDRTPAKERGFGEKVVHLRSTIFRDIAHVLVLYEAHIPGSPRAPQQGVDTWHLVRRDGRWWIASVLNDIPAPGHPLPAELAE